MGSWREFRFEALISLPSKEPYTVELSLEDDSYANAVWNAKQMILKEEKLSDEQEQFIKLELVN